MTCSFKGCDAERYARGWCYSHYQRWRRNGSPDPMKRGPRAVPRPLSLGPALAWARGQGWSQNELAQHLRPEVDCAVARRWLVRRIESGVSVWEADAIAVACGVHPVEWWPDFYEVAA